MANGRHHRGRAVRPEALTDWANGWYFDRRRTETRSEECRADLDALRAEEHAREWTCWRYAFSTTRGVLGESDKTGLARAVRRAGVETGCALVGLSAILVAMIAPASPVLVLLLVFAARLGIFGAVALGKWATIAVAMAGESAHDRGRQGPVVEDEVTGRHGEV